MHESRYNSLVAQITIETELNAPPDVVWADISDIGSHVEWMHDACSITITSAQTQGVGTTFSCLTKVGPIRLTDQMEITEWQENQIMGVSHKGLVSGEGRFTLSATESNTTRFEWSETLSFPWWLGASFGEKIGQVILKRVWGKNLELLKARFRSD